MLTPTNPGGGCNDGDACTSSSKYIFKCPYCEGGCCTCGTGTVRRVAIGGLPWPTQFYSGWGEAFWWGGEMLKFLCIAEGTQQ